MILLAVQHLGSSLFCLNTFIYATKNKMIDVSYIDEQNINLIAHNNSKHKQSNIVSVISAEFKVPHIPAASLNQRNNWKTQFLLKTMRYFHLWFGRHTAFRL